MRRRSVTTGTKGAETEPAWRYSRDDGGGKAGALVVFFLICDLGTSLMLFEAHWPIWLAIVCGLLAGALGLVLLLWLFRGFFSS
jgi:hypothetical protein